MALSRQQIRERKRHLERLEEKNQSRRLSLQELNEAERALDAKQQQRDQLALQTASLCTAILSQIPEHREGTKTIATKATRFIDALLDARYQDLTATTVDPPPDEDDDEDDANDDEPAPLEAVAV
jgi:hypothetical protein